MVIELNSALTTVEQEISDAYVAHQVEGEDRDAVLEQVYNQWRSEADQAIALAKEQRGKSSSES